MPTGYTCIIDDHDDVTFGQYVWRCARAFGALVLMRDDALDAVPPESFEPDLRYYAEALERETAEIDRLLAMTPEQAEEAAKADYRKQVDQWQKSEAERAAVQRRYDQMRDRIERWTPPSSDHSELKKFMLQQLVESRKYSGPYPQPTLVPGVEWRQRRLDETQRSLKYHREHIEAERARTKERNRWLAQLRESVPFEKQPER